MTARLKKCCYGDCPPSEIDHNHCDGSKLFKISFEWDGECQNLRSVLQLNYDGATSGTDCDNGNNPMFVDGDNKQTHWVSVGAGEEASIYIHMYWAELNFVSSLCSVTLTVTDCDSLEEQIVCAIADYTNNGCSLQGNNHIGMLFVEDNGNWTLEPELQSLCLPEQFQVDMVHPNNSEMDGFATLRRIIPDGGRHDTDLVWTGGRIWDNPDTRPAWWAIDPIGFNDFNPPTLRYIPNHPTQKLTFGSSWTPTPSAINNMTNFLNPPADPIFNGWTVEDDGWSFTFTPQQIPQ